jgi:hypothetical protein
LRKFSSINSQPGSFAECAGLPGESIIKQRPEKVNPYRRKTAMEPASRTLLDRVRDAIRLKHYSILTEQAYVHWIKRYIFFHNVRHPAEIRT